MHIRTFRASNFNDALRMIREEMGMDASILHTRRVESGWLGRWGRARIEVTAGLRKSGHNSDGDGISPLDVESATRATAESYLSTMEDCTEEGTQQECHRLVTDLTNHGALDSEARRWILEARKLQQQRDQSVPAAMYSNSCGESPQPAASLEGSVRRSSTTGELAAENNTSHPLRHQLTSWMAGQFETSRPLERRSTQRKVVSLIGATGVGKTTTIAKIAAGVLLNSDVSVGILTLDRFRAAAVEQVQSYADAMRVPLHVAHTSEEMHRGLEAMGDLDLILVDTVGQNPYGEKAIQHLASQLQHLACDETLLVVDANFSRASTYACWDAFQVCHPTGAIISKADQVRQPSGLFSPIVDMKLPLTYVTTGQMVPQDICFADAAIVASWCSGLAVMVP